MGWMDWVGGCVGLKEGKRKGTNLINRKGGLNPPEVKWRS